jgi:hypothetical protein
MSSGPRGSDGARESPEGDDSLRAHGAGSGTGVAPSSSTALDVWTNPRCVKAPSASERSAAGSGGSRVAIRDHRLARAALYQDHLHRTRPLGIRRRVPGRVDRRRFSCHGLLPPPPGSGTPPAGARLLRRGPGISRRPVPRSRRGFFVRGDGGWRPPLGTPVQVACPGTCLPDFQGVSLHDML